MKKLGYIVIGMILGAALLISATSFANGSLLVGKKVQSERELLRNGKIIGTYITVDNKAYAPVRLIGEAAGFIVGFDNNKRVTLDEMKEPEPSASQGNGETKMTVEQLDTKINYLASTISTLESMLQMTSRSEDEKSLVRSQIESLKAEKADLESQKAQLEQPTTP